eukprot:5418356-Pyramimonas_sp.AAC.1
MQLNQRPPDRAFSSPDRAQGWARRDSAPGRHSAQPTSTPSGATPCAPVSSTCPRVRPRHPTKAMQVQAQSDPDFVGA